jgi:hypothetical protein
MAKYQVRALCGEKTFRSRTHHVTDMPLTTCADHIRDDESAAPKVGLRVPGLATNVVDLRRPTSDTA